jgi:heparosan-N-sulfate-glucuronate 5-epimerase
VAGINNKINIGVGNVSNEMLLGRYYQNISPAIVHINEGVFAKLDENGVPYYIEGENKKYIPVLVIQYALMCHDLLLLGIDVDTNRSRIHSCISWLEEKKEAFKDSFVWRSQSNSQYNLPNGWISGMYQGQAISLYLRFYQLVGEESYRETAVKIYNSFKYDYKEGGFKRIDKHGCVWFEEYPSPTPSFVLNGFIYSILGVYDLYRVTKNADAKKLWDLCVHTLEVNIHKYDVWYWSFYDQQKKQLVSYYYQKNVHVPLMQILFLMTNNIVFDKYAHKWKKNLDNPLHRLITKIMYRVQPRIIKILK